MGNFTDNFVWLRNKNYFKQKKGIEIVLKLIIWFKKYLWLDKAFQLQREYAQELFFQLYMELAREQDI